MLSAEQRYSNSFRNNLIIISLMVSKVAFPDFCIINLSVNKLGRISFAVVLPDCDIM
jgi:hypothetical protein